MVTMTAGQVISTLRDEGFEFGRPRLQCAIEAGYVSRPPLDGARRFVFDDSHLEQLRRYLISPPKPGPKPATKQSQPAGAVA